jgi:hypothetical protein
MPGNRFDRCRCSLCRQSAEHPGERHRRELMAFLATLNYEQRRLLAAIEANRLGRGGRGHGRRDHGDV